MNLRAHWQFYKSIFPFIMAFAVVSLFIWGLLWGFVVAITLGFCFGLFGFYSFRKREYLFYFNLGLTRWKLYGVSFLIHLIIGTILLLVLILILILAFGGFPTL